MTRLITEDAILPGLGKVKFYKDAIANVMSLNELSEIYRVTMDTEIENALFMECQGYNSLKNMLYQDNKSTILWHGIQHTTLLILFNLYAFILLTSTIVPGINYFVVINRPLHQLQVRRRRSSSCYMIETYNTRHRFPCY